MMDRISAADLRAMQKPKRDEHTIQVSIVKYLDKVLPPSIRAVGVSNNPRSAIAGAKEKARGMRKGFPDILLTGAFHGLLEVKDEGSYLRPEQKEWRDWASAQQIPYAVVRSVADVRETLGSWRVQTKEPT